jgi:hypothetical protein
MYHSAEKLGQKWWRRGKNLAEEPLLKISKAPINKPFFSSTAHTNKLTFFLFFCRVKQSWTFNGLWVLQLVPPPLSGLFTLIQQVCKIFQIVFFLLANVYAVEIDDILAWAVAMSNTVDGMWEL